MSRPERRCLECGTTLSERASARRKYCGDRCAARARQRRRRQRPTEPTETGTATQLRAELAQERERAQRATAALYAERSHSNRLEARLAQARGRTQELYGQVTALRSRLRLFDRRDGRALIRQANHAAELRDRLTTVTADMTTDSPATADTVDMTTDTDGHGHGHLDDRPLATDSPDAVMTADGQRGHGDRPVATGQSVTGRDRSTADAAVTASSEVTGLRDRLTAVTEKYDGLAGQYRDLFGRYEELATSYNASVATVRQAREERQSIEVLIGHWSELCRRLATATRGRSRSQTDQTILSAWAAFTRRTSETMTAENDR